MEDSALSDYGDDDFDEDTFMELEATINAGPEPSQPTATPTPMARTAVPRPKIQNHTKAAIEDEFGDLDDDIFDDTEELELNPQPKASVVSLETMQNVNEEEDDEFGDDFDGDIDFEAVELAATQSANKHISSSANVC